MKMLTASFRAGNISSVRQDAGIRRVEREVSAAGRFVATSHYPSRVVRGTPPLPVIIFTSYLELIKYTLPLRNPYNPRIELSESSENYTP